MLVTKEQQLSALLNASPPELVTYHIHNESTPGGAIEYYCRTDEKSRFYAGPRSEYGVFSGSEGQMNTPCLDCLRARNFSGDGDLINEAKIFAVKAAERVTFLFDVIVTAVEPDGLPWCDINGYNIIQGEFPTASMEICQFEEIEWLPVTSGTIQTGIDRIMGKDFKINAQLRSLVIVANHENDATDIDSDLADCIIQAGLFGKLIYG